jgi:hypothetical protein
MTAHLTFEQVRQAHPSLPLDVIQRLGHEAGSIRPLVCDGLAGNRTRSGIYLSPQAVLDAGCTPASIALAELLGGAQEEGGPNAGAWVIKYARLSAGATLGRNRGAWCAFFASWVLDQWAKLHGKDFAREGGARAVVRGLKRIAIEEIQVGDLAAWPSLTRAPSWTGHVGICAALTPEGVYTVEGNVDLVPRVDGVSARFFRRDLIRSDGAKPLYAGRLIL